MRGVRTGVALLALVAAVYPVAAEVFPRIATAAGSVIARKTGEEIQFIDLPDWRFVDLAQDLLVGDLLRTNEYGNLAILFADNTQIRIGRNTTLVVKSLDPGDDTLLGLEEGDLWGRAEAGGESIVIETPAAAAAIRGTDWAMRVQGDTTALIVLDGLVDFSNEFGSVSVAQGEAAVATIGSAPTKIVIVDPDDRAQMLFFLSIRNAFNFLPASPLPSRDMRAERTRLAALPPEARSAEDRVTEAEVALSYDGRAAAVAAIAEARRSRLSAAQNARLTLIEAFIAGAEQRYADAARLFAAAQPGLDAKRRAVAAYGGYFSRSLADPSRVEPAPGLEASSPYAAMAAALTAGFLHDIPAAIEVLKRAEARFPDDPTLPAVRAQFALLVDDREQVREAYERALSLDPDEPTALEARANYRTGIESDLDGALEDLERAVAIAPGSTTIWNALGLVLSEQGASREAEEALLRAIELDPQDPASRANLAILYLDQDRLDEAKAQIDLALTYDPTFDIALVARGRYHLQTGEIDKAMRDLLAGSTANPAYSQALLMLAAGYYESGDGEPAAQAMRNADRLDPNDPVTSSFAAAVAIDSSESDTAISSAQETMKRARARGGAYASARANREAGSALNGAFRLQGLDAWGGYYGAVAFDPFNAAGHVDQAIAGSANPFANSLREGTSPVEPGVNESGMSSFVQGLLIDPAMVSARSRSANLFRRPFLEGAIGGGFVNKGGDWGWTAEAELQGYAANPFPWSFYGQVNARRTDESRTYTPPAIGVPTVLFDLGYEDISGVGYLTARPTPNDRVVAYVNVRDGDQALTDAIVIPVPPVILPGPISIDAITFDRRVEDKTGEAGVAWSHTFGHRNVASAALFASGYRRASDEAATIFSDLGPAGLVAIGTRDLGITTDLTTYVGAVNHTYGVDDLTIRYGVEGGTADQSRVEVDAIAIAGGVPATAVTRTDLGLTLGRAYVDLLYEGTPDLTLEAALFGTWLNGPGGTLARAEPRVGVAWTPLDGHFLRAAFLRETDTLSSSTLAPIGMVGLQSNQVSLGVGGYVDTWAARWEAEWGSRFFTSVDYQHQDMFGLAIDVPGSLDTIDIASARIDRVSATANVWLGGGFGAFGTVAYADSTNTDPTSPGFGAPVPYIPELAGRVGFTYVHPSSVKVTLAGTYVGPRVGNAFGDLIDHYWSTDAFLTFEPFGKRLEVELAAYNLLDQRFLVAQDTPGWRRTFTGKLKVRF
ncbi:MAG: FecR domain-containing protein [Rhizobiaceae bacterium]|nr:FecR domain-containing protein [Rhizobiaceae bacterium]